MAMRLTKEQKVKVVQLYCQNNNNASRLLISKSEHSVSAESRYDKLNFDLRRIGQPAAIKRPTRSPNLTTSNFFLVGSTERSCLQAYTKNNS